MTLIDTHLHLDEPAFDGDRSEVVARAADAGVARIVNIAYSPERWQTSQRLQEAYPNIDIVMGLHPTYAAEFDDQTVNCLRSVIARSGAVGIGEIGFDFFRPGFDAQMQERSFSAQFALAVELNLPVVIHQRAAEDVCIAALSRMPADVPVVLHSFDGSWNLGRLGNERGYYFGAGGLMTRAAAVTVREILAAVPIERLLLETDAPYLTPNGIKARRNEPANLGRIAAFLANVRGTTVDAIARETTANAIRVFGLDRSDRTVVGRPTGP